MPSPRCGFSFEAALRPKINHFRIYQKCYFPVKFVVSPNIFLWDCRKCYFRANFAVCPLIFFHDCLKNFTWWISGDNVAQISNIFNSIKFFEFPYDILCKIKSFAIEKLWKYKFSDCKNVWDRFSEFNKRAGFISSTNSCLLEISKHLLIWNEQRRR